MYIRPNTSDDLVIDEAIDYKSLFIDSKESDVFMDIGANIASVSRLAIKQQPNIKIIAFEPECDNYEVAKKNISKNAFLIKKAISDTNGYIKLYKSKSSNKGKTSTVLRDCNLNSDLKIVDCLNFVDVLKQYKPTLIKIDIEGGEYSLKLDNLPEEVKGLAIEIHKIEDDWKKMKEIYEILSNQFTYELGDIPKDDKWYKDRETFLIIFLRNVK